MRTGTPGGHVASSAPTTTLRPRAERLAGRHDRHLELAGVEVRRQHQPFDVRRRDGLEPDGLPDAGLGGVPDLAAVEPLLPAGVDAGLGEVADAHLEEVVTADAVVGDVEGEGEVAAGVRHRPRRR